jgi:hypothetical protein
LILAILKNTKLKPCGGLAWGAFDRHVLFSLVDDSLSNLYPTIKRDQVGRIKVHVLVSPMKMEVSVILASLKNTN